MQDERCNGCNKLVEVDGEIKCKTYPNPAAIWKRGNCPLGTHIVKVKEEKKRVNPLKASKRAKKGK